ncbi:hypothetical protein P7C70_g919, partial [Phenoliferia sp. Uapishka_3]
MSIPRLYKLPNLPPTPSTATPLLPGLISSLRPLKRLSTNLSEEAALLRRFTYKNKNQHKGCGWWKRIVEVDRAVERVGAELGGLLAEFGFGAGEKEAGEGQTVGLDCVLRGVLRVPRSAALVDKFLEILLNCMSILEQLVESRAFLPFSVVVVALVARLHALSIVLQGDIGRLTAVLVRLAKANNMMENLKPALMNLPKTIRRYIILETPSDSNYLLQSTPSTPFGNSPSPAPPPQIPQDDLGAPVSRTSSLPQPASNDIGEVVSRPLPSVKMCKLWAATPPDPPPPETRISEIERMVNVEPLKVKKRRAKIETVIGEGEETLEGATALVKKRKKKEKTKSGKRGDEIDDIFG